MAMTKPRRRSRAKSARAATRFTPATDHRTRIILLFGMVCVGFAMIVYRLLCLQVWWSPAYR